MNPSDFYVDPKKKKRPAAEGKETDTDANVRTVRTQKNPEAFLPQGSC